MLEIFPSPPPSPQRGEGKGEGAQNVRRKLLDLTGKNLKIEGFVRN
jgi:hypothetical protein